MGVRTLVILTAYLVAAICQVSLAQNGSPTMCLVRSQALNAASVLLPGCRRGDPISCENQRNDVYKGLAMSAVCKIKKIPPNIAPLGNETQQPLPLGAVQIYVALNGSDSNNGLSVAGAFRTLGKALQAVAAIGVGQSKIVNLLPGDHRITNELRLTNAHANTVITGPSPSNRARITAAIVLERASNPWMAVNAKVVKCQLSPDVVSKLEPLSMMFVNGIAAIRARAPNMKTALDQVFDLRLARSWGKGRPFPLSHVINRPITPLDDPNTQYASGSPLFRTYSAGYLNSSVVESPFDPPAGYFLNPKNVAQGGCPYTLPTTATWKKTIFGRVWANPTSAMFSALHWYGWGVMTMSVQSQTPNSLKFGPGGWQEPRGDCGKGGTRWYIENVYELLDSANEYFLNRTSGELFYIPPNAASNPVLNPNLVVELTSNARNLLAVTGSSANSLVTNIRIQNIEFFGSYQTTMDRFEQPSGGDYSFHRSGALLIENATNVVVQDCSFRWCGGNGIMISKRVLNTVVQRNELFAIGANAISSVGNPGYFTPDPWVIKEFPENVTITGNVASHIGLFVKQIAGGFVSLSKSIKLSGNVFYWGPRAGIAINDQFGGGTIAIRQNLIFEMVRGTSDMGPIILWNRQQFEEPNAKQYDIIEQNFFFGTPGVGKDGGGKGINVDDGAHKVLSKFNVVAAGFHKMKGSSIHVENNLLIQPISTSCVYFSHFNRLPGNFDFMNNTCITKFPPYAFGVGGKGLDPLCTDRANFVANNNKFYTTAPSRMQNCAKSWAVWTTKWGLDKQSLYTNAMPSISQIREWIASTLPWIPQ